VEPGCPIIPRGSPARVRVGRGLLGRVLDGLGHPIDGKGPIAYEGERPLYGREINPVSKQRISEPIDVGIKAVNGLLTIGKGQRVAIFSGSGVGKSTLLGMRGAYLAAALSEFFRDQGKDVLLMMDSVTRFAMASREVGLSIGEPPTSRGYTPSVFAQLPRLLERAGTTDAQGSITGIYTVLVEGDDLNDPIADAIRSISDGHINLSRELANQGHYPAIDVLGSVSRVMGDVVHPDQMKVRSKLVSLMATYRKAEDLINIGAYVQGNNAQIDEAIKKMPEINAFLQQQIGERVTLPDSVKHLKALFAGKGGGVN
jgi:flagellum-specific ATP synthase